MYIKKNYYFGNILNQFSLFLIESIPIVSDIDTDELDSDRKNVEEEKVEFLVKEEVNVIE